MPSDSPDSQPQPLAYYNPTLEPRRPASIKVLAILGIIFGIFTLRSFVRVFIYYPLKYPQFRSTISKFHLVLNFLWLILIGFLLVACINSICLRRSGRRQMIYWACFSIVIQSLMMIQTMVWIAKIYLSSSIAGRVMNIWPLVEYLFWLVFPVLVLIFYRKPAVIAAFESASHKSASA